MALILEQECVKCHCTKMIECAYNHTGMCGDCIKEEEDNKLKVHLYGLSLLSVEERLAKIEEWIYKHEQYHPQIDLPYR